MCIRDSFYSPSCHACAKVKNELLPEVKQIFREQIDIDYRNIDEIENYKLLLGFMERHGITQKTGVPVLFLEEHFLSGGTQINAELIPLIEKKISQPREEEKQEAASFGNIISHFSSFSPWAVISAGLIDGVNPCAFTVIVFFISFLSLQGYRKRELTLIGLSFIAIVFLTYFFIGLGLFNFLYRIRAFWHLIRIVNIIIGLACVILGFFALYDFFRFRKTRRTEGLILKLPEAVKKQIQRIIGLFYRRRANPQINNLKINLPRLLASAIITGFLVSILEAVCTGQVYLPTIVFVLKTTHFKLEAFGYLLLYNFMFVVPLIIIFLFALLGATSSHFAKFLNRNLAAVKILMAVLFFTLGVLLIWRA